MLSLPPPPPPIASVYKTRAWGTYFKLKFSNSSSSASSSSSTNSCVLHVEDERIATNGPLRAKTRPVFYSGDLVGVASRTTVVSMYMWVYVGLTYSCTFFTLQAIAACNTLELHDWVWTSIYIDILYNAHVSPPELERPQKYPFRQQCGAV